jgi:hypothetical protein
LKRKDLYIKKTVEKMTVFCITFFSVQHNNFRHPARSEAEMRDDIVICSTFIKAILHSVIMILHQVRDDEKALRAG